MRSHRRKRSGRISYRTAYTGLAGHLYLENAAEARLYIKKSRRCQDIHPPFFAKVCSERGNVLIFNSVV